VNKRLDMNSRWSNSTLARSLTVISRRDKRKIILVTGVQIFMGGLDLLGVALIGVLGALAVNGVSSNKPGDRISTFLELLRIEDLSFQNQAAFLGILASVILVSRTLLSIFFTRRTLYFLSRRAATISSELISQLFGQSITFVQKRSSQETLYSVTTGVSAITLGVIATSVSLIADFSLLLVMAVGLFVVDPLMSISTFLVFLMIGLILYRYMHTRAVQLGKDQASKSIESNEKIIEVLDSYRESVVRHRRDYYAEEIGKIRLSLSNNLAQSAFMPYVSKYIIETTVVLGSLAIAAAQFILQDAARAVATLSVFMAAGTRIAPAVLRVQQGAISIQASLGAAKPTLDLIDEIYKNDFAPDKITNFQNVHYGFEGNVTLENVTYKYPNAEINALESIDLRINHGESIAIVGPSGSGKTTLVDILLGILSPTSGLIQLSNLSPEEATKKWPGAISYVPQDITISNGTVRENVTMGYTKGEIPEKLIWEALEKAQISDFVNSLPMSLDSPLGEKGTKISGGQRQRIGIARALITSPRLLVLDEATSALDGKIEATLTEAIHKLKSEVTVITIAHRLSTVVNSDKVCYINSGKLIAFDTFSEVRKQVPDFDIQARLIES
jgi:ABC-type multidrug transport system fused ATPase/permease subunit